VKIKKRSAVRAQTCVRKTKQKKRWFDGDFDGDLCIQLGGQRNLPLGNTRGTTDRQQAKAQAKTLDL